MANPVYKRVSTDQQSTARQNLVLDEAGIEDPVVFEEDPGTSSRLHPLQRPKFRELLTYARPGDAVHISEMFRLVRGTGQILDVRTAYRNARRPERPGPQGRVPQGVSPQGGTARAAARGRPRRPGDGSRTVRPDPGTVRCGHGAGRRGPRGAVARHRDRPPALRPGCAGRGGGLA
ncbi:recombinase family protein, partial [Streptomyces sp. NPDC003691]